MGNRRRGRHGIVAAVVVALATSGCGGESAAGITDEASALRAVADSFAGSWSWAGQLEVDVDDADIEAFIDADWPDASAEERELAADQARRALDDFGRQRMHGALGDDQSFRSAWERDGTDLVDLRLDFGEVLTADSMTPSAALLGAADVAAIIETTREAYAYAGDDPADAVTVEEVRAQASQIPEPDLREVALAIVDGGFGGIVGQLHLAAAGVSEEQLDELRAGFAEQFIGLADAETFTEFAGQALTVRDLRAEGATTTAVVDVHPRDAVQAVYDLFDDAEALAQGIGDGHLSEDELPETLSEVARLTFDADGHLVEVRTDVIALATQLAGSLELGAEGAELLEVVEDATADVVFTFADHDAIDTVADVEATTVPWERILEFFTPAIDDALAPTTG